MHRVLGFDVEHSKGRCNAAGTLGTGVMEPEELQRLFSACDVDKSGRIEYEDLAQVCGELGVPPAETDKLFQKLDEDEDGSISFSDFSARYLQVSEALDIASLSHRETAWGQFEDGLEGGLLHWDRCRDQLAALYQQIHSSSNTSLLLLYEDLVKSLVSEGKEHHLELLQLENSLRRADEMTEHQLAEMEEDAQRELHQMELKVKEEEQLRLQAAIAAIRREHEDEAAELQVTVEKLKLEQAQNSSSRDDVVHLKSQIQEMMLENEHLQSSLTEAQTNVSVLQAELDKLKNEYTDQKLQHQRENEDLKKLLVECQSYSSHVDVLQKLNKKLYDNNDGLRSALASNAGQKASIKKQRASRRPFLIRQSTLNHISFLEESENMADPKTKYPDVASWADRYLDSGVSLPSDNISWGSEDDSDVTQDSVETLHHSYSCVPSEAEMSETTAPSTVSSKYGSITSSIRRRLSAFPSKMADQSHLDADLVSPTYRLVLAGDAGSGKSSFLLRLTKNEFRSDIQTTLGVDFQMKQMLVDGEMTNLQIWDTAGQERFRSIAKSYFRKAHGVLMLYDITSEQSFLNIREWMDQIEESTEQTIPKCLVGNKVDLRGAQPEEGTVSTTHGEKLAMTYSALFCESSAKEGTNVVEAVLHLAREVKKSAHLKRHSKPQMNLSLAERKMTFSNCCGV